jgi:hypothetical protein
MARQEVSQALLKVNCFPAGMELFPAADQEQFEFIKEVIDESDYYVVISAGRYGSIHPALGVSYTELEYDYALKKSKPVIRLLHRDPFSLLPGRAIEATEAGRSALVAFREKMSRSRMVNFWESPTELGQQVVLGLLDAQKRHPSAGWARANRIATADAELTIAELRARVAELEASLSSSEVSHDLGALLSIPGEVTVTIYRAESFDPNFVPEYGFSQLRLEGLEF